MCEETQACRPSHHARFIDSSILADSERVGGSTDSTSVDVTTSQSSFSGSVLTMPPPSPMEEYLFDLRGYAILPKVSPNPYSLALRRCRCLLRLRC